MGSRPGPGHQGWYDAMGSYYDHLYDPRRPMVAYAFLHDLFRRRGPVKDILDVGCGTFAVDLPLVRRGYRVVGRDLSNGMLEIARRNLRDAGLHADVARGDLRSLRVRGVFDAILCLGTTFNYVVPAQEVGAVLRSFRAHLRTGGLLVLDLTHFDPWIRRPENVRAEGDYRHPDGTHIAVYSFNDQDLARDIHFARFVTIVHRPGKVDLYFDESPLRIWRRENLQEVLSQNGFRVLEWWGDLRLSATYRKKTSPRLVCVARRA